jgi:DNA-binding SARP family transcriptional activator
MANKKEQLYNDLTRFVEQSRWVKAVQVLEGLIALEPANATYYLRMGDYSVKVGNRTKAVRAYYQAAQLFVDWGFTVKGIATYKMILRFAPGEQRAAELIRAINPNLGGTDEAPSPPAPEAAPQGEMAPTPLTPAGALS